MLIMLRICTIALKLCSPPWRQTVKASLCPIRHSPHLRHEEQKSKPHMNIKPIQSQLKKQRIDSALFIVQETSIPSFTYITQLPHLTYAALLIKQSGKPILFVSSLDYGGIKSTHLTIELLKKPLREHLKAHCQNVKTLGIEFTTTTYALVKRIKKIFPNTTLKDTTNLFETTRTTKTEAELNNLETAASIANHAFNNMIKNFNYKTESDLKIALESEFLKHNVTPSFPTIVASGKNAATPHHKTSTASLTRGFCVIDFGVIYNGYCSDCTRTIFIGKPTKQEVALYNLVRKAQESALKQVKIGIKTTDLDAIARKVLGHYEKHFSHSLGHGIGIEVHESPSVSKKSKDVLKSGMVITIEPGYYHKNIGIRIEDTVIVQKNPKVITTISKELMSFDV